MSSMSIYTRSSPLVGRSRCRPASQGLVNQLPISIGWACTSSKDPHLFCSPKRTWTRFADSFKFLQRGLTVDLDGTQEPRRGDPSWWTRTRRPDQSSDHAISLTNSSTGGGISSATTLCPSKEDERDHRRRRTLSHNAFSIMAPATILPQMASRLLVNPRAWALSQPRVATGANRLLLVRAFSSTPAVGNSAGNQLRRRYQAQLDKQMRTRPSMSGAGSEVSDMAREQMTSNLSIGKRNPSALAFILLCSHLAAAANQEPTSLLRLAATLSPLTLHGPSRSEGSWMP